MAKHLVIAVDWFGPYLSIQEAQAALKTDYGNAGLYFALGKVDPDDPIRPQYVGISSSLSSRVSTKHTTLAKISDLRLWIGEVGTARPSGKQIKKTPITLDYAEWLTAYFMDLPLNVKKRSSVPDVAVSLLNRWWKKDDYETPTTRRPHPDWPDFIDYLGHYYTTKLVWFGGKLRREPPVKQWLQE